MQKFQSAVQWLQEMVELDSVFSNSFFWLCLAILGLYDSIRKFLKNATCSLLYIAYNHRISTPSLFLLTLYSPKILLESVMKDLDIRILYVFHRFSSTFPPSLGLSTDNLLQANQGWWLAAQSQFRHHPMRWLLSRVLHEGFKKKEHG